jgi:Zn-dependent protease with chaperone function
MNANRFLGRSFLAAVFAFSLVVMLAFSVAKPPEFPDPGHPRMSRDQQQKLGLQAAAQVYQQTPVLPDSSPETQYIQALGKRLVAVIPKDRTWPYQFHVVAQKEVNAFALPGGPMFVNIGTITTVDNEAELAGVMAHEMGHVYMQHSAKQQEKSAVVGGIADLVGAIAGGLGGGVGGLAQTGIQIGAGTLMLKYSRADESQADAFGAIVLWRAHYNPMALADFFKKLQASSKNGPQFLSDHPNPGNREEAIQSEVRDWPPQNYAGDSPQFATVRMHGAGVRAYTAQEIAAGAKTGRWQAENAKNGAVIHGAPAGSNQSAATAAVPTAPLSAVLPSGKFQTANVDEATIDRPDNWPVMPGQQSSVTIAPRAGAAGGAVAYGVVIQSVSLPGGSDASPQQVTSAIAQSLQSGDGNMKQNGNIEAISVAGMPAGSLQLTTVSPMPSTDGRQQPERDWLVAVPRGGGKAIYFVFVAPAANFDQLKPTFERMFSSIHF